jgi:hypothetical protein
MWGDRLIDGKKYDFGEWEASTNGTAAAIDLIPKDIIVCPWHYELRDNYPSIPTNVILLLAMMNANLISGEPDNTDTIA